MTYKVVKVDGKYVVELPYDDCDETFDSSLAATDYALGKAARISLLCGCPVDVELTDGTLWTVSTTKKP